MMAEEPERDCAAHTHTFTAVRSRQWERTTAIVQESCAFMTILLYSDWDGLILEGSKAAG